MAQSHKEIKTVGDIVDEIKGTDSKEEVYAKLNAALEKNPHIGENALDQYNRTPYIRAVLHKDPNIFVAEWLEDSREHRAHGRRWHTTSPGLEMRGYGNDQRYYATALMHAASFPDTGEDKADNITDVRRKFIHRVLAKRFPHDRIATASSEACDELVKALQKAITCKNNYFVYLCRQKFPSITAGTFHECKYAVDTYQPETLEKIYSNSTSEYTNTTEAITNAIVTSVLDAYQAKILDSHQAKHLLDIAKKRYGICRKNQAGNVDVITQLENIEQLCFQFRDVAPRFNDKRDNYVCILRETTAWYARDIISNAIKCSAINAKMIEDLFPYLDFTVFGERYGFDKNWNAKYWKEHGAAIIPCFNTLDGINKFIDKLLHDLSNVKSPRQEPEDVLGYLCEAAKQLEGDPSCSPVVLSFLTTIGTVLARSPINIDTLSDETTTAISAFFGKHAKDLPECHTYYDSILLGYLTNKARTHYGPGALVKTLFTTQPPASQQEENKPTLGLALTASNGTS